MEYSNSNHVPLPLVVRAKARKDKGGSSQASDVNRERSNAYRVKGPRPLRSHSDLFYHSSPNSSQEFSPPRAQFAQRQLSARSEVSTDTFNSSSSPRTSTPASSWSGHSEHASPKKPAPVLRSSTNDLHLSRDRSQADTALRSNSQTEDFDDADRSRVDALQTSALPLRPFSADAARGMKREMQQIGLSRTMQQPRVEETLVVQGSRGSQRSLNYPEQQQRTDRRHPTRMRPQAESPLPRVVSSLEPMVDLEEQEKVGLFSKFKSKYINASDAPIVLPSPPTEQEKFCYLKTRRAPLYAFGLLSFMSLSAGMWLFVISSPAFYWFGVLVGLLQLYLMISYWVGFCGSDYDFEAHKRVLQEFEVKDESAPTVDIYLPCCKEPMQILENTYKFIQTMDYPKDKLNVYVLDDGGMSEVQSMAQSYGFHYISRSDKPRLKKAGNLRWAFARTSGEFFVIYDADFCPRPDFLRDLIPHLRNDSQIAILQTPQFFRVTPDQTWVEQGAGAIQELFYRLVQMNRDRWGGSICVGSNAVYRREALVETGGTAEIGFSEDVHTGFYSVDRGWTVKYIPICYACGICPDNMHAFFSQQMRWCMGSTTLLSNPEFWKSRLSLVQKLCYLSGMMYYSATAAGIFISPLPGVLVMWVRPDFLKYFNLAFAVPSILYSLIIFRLWSRASVTLAVNYIMVIQAYAYLTAIKDRVFGRALAWAPSGDKKAHKNTKFRNMRILAWCWTIIYTGVLVSGTVYRILGGYAWYNFLPFLLLNAMHMFYAHRFLLWRL